MSRLYWEQKELTVSVPGSSDDDEDGDMDDDSRPRHFKMAWTVLWKAEHGELRRG